jgi:hypothetical protein
MAEMWAENMRHRESIRILKTQLQDANRKLAARGDITTSELVDVWAKRAEQQQACDAYNAAKSLTQQDWKMLEDYEAATWKDWNETRMDARHSGCP